jgi:hypothetical protein
MLATEPAYNDHRTKTGMYSMSLICQNFFMDRLYTGEASYRRKKLTQFHDF